jgi:hypothetical protein
LAKLNVIAGFDMPHALGHHTGGYLGNYARNDSSTYGKGNDIPSLDQVMAYSPSFYSDLGSILLRSIHLGTSDDGRAVSFYWGNSEKKSGGIVPIAGTNDSLTLFNKIFVVAGTGMSTRIPVIDQVYVNYQRLLQSNRRLSTDDRMRLEEHMTRIAEIQRRAHVVASCPAITRPTTNASQYWQYPNPQGIQNSIQAFQLLNDIIVAAFQCGTCRIATLDADLAQGPFTNFVGGYQGTVDFHSLIHLTSQTNDPTQAMTSQSIVWSAWQGYFEKAFLDLVTKLNVDDGTGSTLLDSCLVVWEQECGSITHSQVSVPIITAGSAGGNIRTGSYIDYRNRAVSRSFNSAANQVFNPGLVWNQWMGVKLQAMGVSPSEYEIPTFQPTRPSGAGTGGFGWFDDAQAGGVAQVGDYDSAFPVLGEVPPYLKP